MTRLLFWGLIILCALVAVRLTVRRARRSPGHSARHASGARAHAAPQSAEPMVLCAHCGVYLPRSDALQRDGQTWCCGEHADAHQQ